MRPLATALVAVAALSSCAAHKIPGTEIDDTSDTRAVLDTVNAYRIAFEHKNVASILELTDEAYQDNGGTSVPDDDYDYARLKRDLPARFNRVEDPHLDISVRKVEYDNDGKAAQVTYLYTLGFKLPGVTSRSQQETDIKQMTLRRAGEKTWKITSGL